MSRPICAPCSLIREGSLGKIQAIESAFGFNIAAGEWRLGQETSRRRPAHGCGNLFVKCLPLSDRRGAGNAFRNLVGNRWRREI